MVTTPCSKLLAEYHGYTALLPLTVADLGCDAGQVNRTEHQTTRIHAFDLAKFGHRLAHGVASSAKAVAAALAECNRAQRTLADLRLQPDRYALDGDAAPCTYAEFLFRSQAAIWREPSARERAGTALPRRR
jgi:hypothetical protein